MEQEEAALQEEGGLTDMIDSLKATRADGVESTPEEEPTIEPEPVGDDEDHVDDTTDLSIDQKIALVTKKAKRELNHFYASDSSLAGEIQINYAKQHNLL